MVDKMQVSDRVFLATKAAKLGDYAQVEAIAGELAEAKVTLSKSDSDDLELAKETSRANAIFLLEEECTTAAKTDSLEEVKKKVAVIKECYRLSGQQFDPQKETQWISVVGARSVTRYLEEGLEFAKKGIVVDADDRCSIAEKTADNLGIPVSREMQDLKQQCTEIGRKTRISQIEGEILAVIAEAGSVEAKLTAIQPRLMERQTRAIEAAIALRSDFNTSWGSTLLSEALSAAHNVASVHGIGSSLSSALSLLEKIKNLSGHQIDESKIPEIRHIAGQKTLQNKVVEAMKAVDSLDAFDRAETSILEFIENERLGQHDVSLTDFQKTQLNDAFSTSRNRALRQQISIVQTHLNQESPDVDGAEQGIHTGRKLLASTTDRFKPDTDFERDFETLLKRVGRVRLENVLLANARAAERGDIEAESLAREKASHLLSQYGIELTTQETAQLNLNRTVVRQNAIAGVVSEYIGEIDFPRIVRDLKRIDAIASGHTHASGELQIPDKVKQLKSLLID